MPCIYPKECWSLIVEMLQTIIGDQAPASSSLPMIIVQKPEASLAELMVSQYVETFNNIRKNVVTR